MAETDPGTLAPDSPSTLAAEPAPEQPPEQGAAEPQPEREEPPEGEERQETEEEPPPWASVREADALLEHEQVAPLIQERMTEAEKRGLSQAQSRMQPYLQRQEQLLGSINDSLQKFAREHNRLARSEDIDQEKLGLLIEDNREVFDTLRGVAVQHGRITGVQEAVTSLLTTGGAGDRTQEFQRRIANVQQGLSDETFFDDLREALTKGAVAQAKEKWEKEQTKLRETREQAEARANGRSEQKPPAKPQGGGAGKQRSDAEILADPNTPVEKLIEIRNRQKAGG